MTMILLSFLQDSGEQPHNIPAYRFWTFYMKNGLTEAGLKWGEIPGVDWAAGLAGGENELSVLKWRELAWEKTLKYIKENLKNIDFFLCYLYPRQIDISAIKEIRKLGVPCVNFYCDNVREFTKLPDEFKIFDLMWVPEFDALTMYEKANINHIHLAMPVWVSPEYRTSPENEGTCISFIGSKDDLRERFFSQAISKGLPLEIRGSNWLAATDHEMTFNSSGKGIKIRNQVNLLKKIGLRALLIRHLKRFEKPDGFIVPGRNIFEKPDFEEYVKITRESLITLGFNEVPTYKSFDKFPLTYSRLRDLEAPMLGACYLTEFTAGLSQLYELGREIETYATVDELIFKCNELAKSKHKRQELRFLGQKKALYAHSIPESLKMIRARLFK